MESVHEWLNQLLDVSKTRKAFMAELFTTLQGLRGKANYLNLSRYMAYHERTIRRHVRQAFPFQTLKAQMARKMLSGRCLLVGDATFVHKSGKKTYGLDRFWNGCANRTERGLEVSVLALVDAQRNAIALTARQTPAVPKEDKKPKHIEEKRLTFYLEQLKASQPAWPEDLKYGVFDGFYAKQPFVEGVCGLGLEITRKLRHDANLKYLYAGPQKPRGTKRKFDGKVYYDDMSRFESLGELEPSIHAWTQKVWHVTLQREIRVVMLLNAKKPEKQSPVVSDKSGCHNPHEILL